MRVFEYNEDGDKVSPEPKVWYLYMISGCLIYPLIYDGNQFLMQGPMEYFNDPWNYVDMIHIFGGYFNVYA